MKPRETVDRLIALALDSAASENEKRNAALQAVKLIGEHKLLDRKTPLRRSLSDLHSPLFDLLMAANFDGAIRYIETLKRRVEKVSADRIRNNRRDIDAEPLWTEVTMHNARRATQFYECMYCGETIPFKVWVVNPLRGARTGHLRCFRDKYGKSTQAR
jgi:5-methylcytosine-specific restriction endonuclease McrA